MPREPSTPRIAVWRQLKRLGVVQIGDGLVGLPADARTREQLDWVADEVIEAGGTASVWVARPGSAAQQGALATLMADAVAVEYRQVIAEAGAAGNAEMTDRRRIVARLQRELHRIGQRDRFPPPERDLARTAVRDVARVAESVS